MQRSDIIVDVDCKDKRTGNTALIWAAKKGHNKVSGAQAPNQKVAVLLFQNEELFSQMRHKMELV